MRDVVVDFSYQELTSLKILRLSWKTVAHLILDGNYLTDNIQFPRMKCLKTLSLNKNYITNLQLLCQKLKKSCPNLHHLSLIGNPACSHPALRETAFDESLYNEYRLQIIKNFPQLIFLDSTFVTKQERELARIICKNFVDVSFNVEKQINICKYGKVCVKYQGKQSEGNRFIRDNHL